MATDPVEERARQVEAQMTDEERIGLTRGYVTMPLLSSEPPAEARTGAGFVPGVPRLNVPPLWETDATMGVTWLDGARGSGATQLPSAIAQGATWNADLLEEGGRMIGAEAHAKGFNVLLAGGINLMREVRNGRTFEYLGEDPLHSGLLGGAAIRGIQSNNIISTIKHFAINPQETGRQIMDARISDANIRESDLLAFEIAMEIGNPGAVMCAYNATNGPLSCNSKYLLTDVLRDDWGYKGFVMSDWGAVESLDFAMAGLDQQSGAEFDEGLFLGEPLLEAAQQDEAWSARLGEMARRVLYAIYDHGLDTNLPVETAVDAAANEEIALQVAREGIVLLSNPNGILPLGPDVESIAVIGGHADAGTMVGGGSSRVFGDEGPSITEPGLRAEHATYASFTDPAFNRSAPLAALREMAPDAKIDFRDGRYASEAAQLASRADIAIVFADQFMTEGFDAPDLSLPDFQDALIAAVAAANPNTIVVLQTGGPVTMPWKDDVAAIVEAWYPGARGGEAIAEVLLGRTNPSGHLPITFPADIDQTPRPVLDGQGDITPSFFGKGAPGQKISVDYDIEGSDVGYRWFAKQGATPLFPFGHGLSYTEFEYGDLAIEGAENGSLSARFTIKNVGDRAGADVAQVYLVSVDGETRQRLVGFAKRELAPGASAEVRVTFDPRVLSEWNGNGWTAEAGSYAFALGQDASDTDRQVAVSYAGIELDEGGNRVGTKASQ
ncbi:beta-glucosidase family protein [Croceicoccus gelatinilyticus]|uniref:beta-glucosidase family protein n=1 Tax=Croceicoccus gelatinilyticus TaxID=2835536 RepID=UPI00308070E9